MNVWMGSHLHVYYWSNGHRRTNNSSFYLACLFEGLEQIPLSLVIRILNGR